MSRNRFVTDATKRLPLSDGDWIEVKERITHGEQKRIAGAAIAVRGVGGALAGSTDALDDASVTIDLERAEQVRMEVYLADWSFKDDDDKPVELTPSAIAALDTETAEEIVAALDRHVAEVGEEKKASSGKPSASRRSP